jgi:hypothetical protein
MTRKSRPLLTRPWRTWDVAQEKVQPGRAFTRFGSLLLVAGPRRVRDARGRSPAAISRADADSSPHGSDNRWHRPIMLEATFYPPAGPGPASETTIIAQGDGVHSHMS